MGDFLFLTFDVRWLQETLRFNNTLSISNAKFHFSGNIFLVWNNHIRIITTWFNFLLVLFLYVVWEIEQSYIFIITLRVYTSNNILLLEPIGLLSQTKNISGHWVQLFLCWLDVLLHFPFYVAWSAQIERYTNLTF